MHFPVPDGALSWAEAPTAARPHPERAAAVGILKEPHLLETAPVAGAAGMAEQLALDRFSTTAEQLTVATGAQRDRASRRRFLPVPSRRSRAQCRRAIASDESNSSAWRAVVIPNSTGRSASTSRSRSRRQICPSPAIPRSRSKSNGLVGNQARLDGFDGRIERGTPVMSTEGSAARTARSTPTEFDICKSTSAVSGFTSARHASALPIFLKRLGPRSLANRSTTARM